MQLFHTSQVSHCLLQALDRPSKDIINLELVS